MKIPNTNEKNKTKQNKTSNPPAKLPFAFISPGNLHDVLMTGLKPETLYRYQVGTGGVVLSDWIRFVSPPIVGPSSEVDFLIFGDMGVKTPFDHTDFWESFGVEQVHNNRFISLFLSFSLTTTTKFKYSNLLQ